MAQSVATAESPEHGSYLTDVDGLALYIFTKGTADPVQAPATATVPQRGRPSPLTPP